MSKTFVEITSKKNVYIYIYNLSKLEKKYTYVSFQNQRGNFKTKNKDKQY